MQKRYYLEDISEESIRQMIPCFKPVIREYQKGQIILSYPDTGAVTNHLAVMLSGSAELQMVDEDGDVFLLEELGEMDLFGEMFTLLVSGYEYLVVADSPCRIMFVDYRHVVTPCEKLCPHHSQLISNLFVISAQKAQEISFHISVLGQKTTREKLLYYLKYARLLAGAKGGEDFELPCTLSRLAEYLQVDRAAMSREIRAMNEEGLIESSQRKFRILAAAQ